MSRYSGPQGKGARRAVRKLKQQQAYERQMSYRARTGQGLYPAAMVPQAETEAGQMRG